MKSNKLICLLSSAVLVAALALPQIAFADQPVGTANATKHVICIQRQSHGFVNCVPTSFK